MWKADMEELFRTVPDEPEGFREHCFSLLSEIPIYYRRNGKVTDCRCGKCGKVFILDLKPVRHETASCPCCGNAGYWEWMKVTRSTYESHDIALIQCTSSGELVIRAYRANMFFKQGIPANIKLIELKRIFLRLGDVKYYNNENHFTSKGWKREWREGKGGEPVGLSGTYAGWRREVKESCLKYCDVDGIRGDASRFYNATDVLIAFANNPALEMYAKSGMTKIVSLLLMKEGKTHLINRRGKSLLSQLRIKDKAAVNRLVAGRGDPILLKILQTEKKTGQIYTEEQEQFLARQYSRYDGEKKINYLLRYMSIQKLMNRVEKYKTQQADVKESAVIDEYVDYLNMRQELGYDMTNEIYVYPKNLKAKHDQMVVERNAKRDDLHIQKTLKKFPDIAKRYKKLTKQYSFEFGDYLIRPAADAGEIVIEGRVLHHCVGGENYLRKHNDGKTAILFLRKKESRDIPYYTIEIRNNEILQWYGAYDKKLDREIIEPWLDAYVAQLTKKSTSVT